MSEKQTLTPLEARHVLWNRGILTFKLDPNQQVLYKTYKESKEKITVWNCSRGQGKSYTLCVTAIQECLNNPKALVKYCCPKQKDARQIIQPLFRDILEDCPDELRPRYNVGEGAYKFPNGAQIQLSGLDNGRSESLRGGSAQLCIVDEAGSKSLKDLEYIVQSILLPSVTRTKEINGKIILASTPPISADHAFVTFLRQADINNSSVTRNIHTNPRMTKEMIQQIINSCGGELSTTFRREYLCHIITDSESAVVPEFTEELQSRIVKTWIKPAYYDWYTAMDLGLKDLTVVLFAYYDFRAAKLIIEDEFVINGQKFNTSVLAENIKRKESELFSDPFTGEIPPPYKRVSDNNLIVIQDLYQLHNLHFLPTKKDDADAALNNLKILLAAEKIIINPKCITLIRHLRDATWNKAKTSFNRTTVDGSHYDALDSAKYLIRNVNFTHNPYPANYGSTYSDSYYEIQKQSQNKYESVVRTMTNTKKR